MEAHVRAKGVRAGRRSRAPAPDRPPAFPPRRSHARRNLAVAAALLIALTAAYGLWLRDSSLVRVERVRVTGLSGPDAPRMRAALGRAGRAMTTLNVRAADLERAVAAHPGLKGVEVSPRLPHELDVRVVEHRPVARLVSGAGAAVPVAADGTLLRGVTAARDLPSLDVRPGRVHGGRLGDRSALRTVRALAAAPAVFVPEVEGAGEEGGRGLVVRLRRGPDLVFGAPRELDAKWDAVVGVLADGGARGAAYVDVRLPDRPVAGGLDEPASGDGASEDPAVGEGASPGAAPQAQPGVEP